ncbi:competence protein CoiA [Lysinibacillus sp. LZ02]|uniref:competence protein CoiA n=1 Tax=Lysinibacillus sp. LZ02 TaxID=3420668 RepID=UPI003D36F2B1
MLVAIDDQGDYLILTKSLTEAALQQLREKPLYCPHCKERLILKAGAIKIPHFAHTANRACESLFAEGESELHLLGKQQLFMHFQQLGYDVQLESYLPHLQQRPDLLITRKKRYALEFQCSRIPEQLLHQRTEGYKKNEIVPIWLLKTPAFPTLQVGRTLKASFNLFYQQFITDNYVITYDPQSQQFVYFSDLLYLQGNLFLSQVLALPLTSQVFPFYEPKLLTEKGFLSLFEEYTRYRKQFLHGRLFYSQAGVNDLFLRAVYECQLQRVGLPPYIGVPVPHARGISLFSAEWQMLFFYFMSCNNLTIESVNDSTKHHFLSWAKLPNTQQSFLAIDDYVKILRALSISDISATCTREQLMRVLYSELIAIC